MMEMTEWLRNKNLLNYNNKYTIEKHNSNCKAIENENENELFHKKKGAEVFMQFSHAYAARSFQNEVRLTFTLQLNQVTN